MKKMMTRCLIYLLCLSLPATSVYASLPALPSDKGAATTENSKVNDALAEFRSLKKSEKKARVKEARKAIKQFKADKKAGKASDDETVLLVILSILLPPLAVYLKEDAITSHFWIDLILTLIFWIPGVIFALLVVLDAI